MPNASSSPARRFWPRAVHLSLLAAGAGYLIARPALAQDAGDAGGGSGVAASPFSLLLNTLLDGDVISLIIVALSIVAVTLIIQAAIRVRKSVLVPETSDEAIRNMIEQRRYKELLEFTENDPSFVSRSLAPALRRAPNFTLMKEALEVGVGEETAEEFRRLEYINILANIGPLLGLMGTVFGIMSAFTGLASTDGNADVGSLASGISVALGTTLLGLILAVPCVVAYGIFRTRVDRITTEGALRAEDHLLMMKAEGGSSSSSGSSGSSGSSSSGRSSARATPKAKPAE
jgi:biopolymer transport protein ExbB